MKKMLMLSSVASMIDQFNMPNIILLQNMGYSVDVACNFNKGNTCTDEKIITLRNKLDKMGVMCHQIDFARNVFNIDDNLLASRQLSTLMKENKYSFVHCHSPIGGVIGRLVAHKYQVKVIYTAHGFHFYQGAPLINWLIYYPIEKWLARYTDVLITINNEDFKNAVNKKFKAGKIELVNGVGVNLNRFKPQSDVIRNDLRVQYGYSKDDFILIYVGELSYRKNQDMLINVVNNLIVKIPNLKLLLVGTGILEKRYEKRIIELGVENQVKLLGFRKDVEKLMTLSDIAVSSSRQEGLPVNVMEAMAIGLPLVVTDCRGNRDLVTNEKNGFVTGINDVDGFSNAVENLYKSDKLRKKFSKESLLRIKKYSLENIISIISDIYNV